MIATPGSLEDRMNRKLAALPHVKILVLGEADRRPGYGITAGNPAHFDGFTQALSGSNETVPPSHCTIKREERNPGRLRCP